MVTTCCSFNIIMRIYQPKSQKLISPEIHFSPLLIDAVCFVHTQIATRIVLNCEQESLLLEADFELHPFGEPVVLLSGSPNGQRFLRVNKEGQVYHSDQSLLEWQQMNELSGTPLEIRWLPDSTGFLYRTQGQLHHFEFSTNQSRLLLESDLFSDYANINAIWVEFE
jgi:hypothetical protein